MTVVTRSQHVSAYDGRTPLAALHIEHLVAVLLKKKGRPERQLSEKNPQSIRRLFQEPTN
jgi:hypothetical protein